MASEAYFFPEPVYIAMDGMIVREPLKTRCWLEVTVILIAAFYLFNVEYPQHCNVFPFLEAVLFYNTNIIKNRVVVYKIIISNFFFTIYI